MRRYFTHANVLQGVLLIGWIVFNMVRKNVSFALISLVPLPLMFFATT